MTTIKPIEEVIKENEELHQENTDLLIRNSELKALSQYLKAFANSKDPLKTLVDYLEVAKPKQPTIILDRQYQIHYISHRACTLLDYKRIEGVSLIHRPYKDLISDPQEKVIFEMNTLKKEPFVQRINLRKKRGLAYVDSKVTNYLMVGGHLAGVVIELEKAGLIF